MGRGGQWWLGGQAYCLKIFFYFLSKKHCHILSTRTLRKLLTDGSSGSYLKRMISHFSLFPTPTCLENISFHFRPLLLILVRESVIVEPQLTHLETPICGGHNFVDLFSATSFCYTDLFHLKPWPSTSSWTESRGGSCICNESFGVPGVSSICLGKTKRDVPYVCVCLSLILV